MKKLTEQRLKKIQKILNNCHKIKMIDVFTKKTTRVLNVVEIYFNQELLESVLAENLYYIGDLRYSIEILAELENGERTWIANTDWKIAK